MGFEAIGKGNRVPFIQAVTGKKKHPRQKMGTLNQEACLSLRFNQVVSFFHDVFEVRGVAGCGGVMGISLVRDAISSGPGRSGAL